MTYTVSFLENPRGKRKASRRPGAMHKRRAASLHKKHPAKRAKRAKPSGTRRAVPAGYKSWKEYMAHIRGMKKGHHHSRSTAMATKKKAHHRKTTTHHKRKAAHRPRGMKFLGIPLGPRENPAGRRRGGLMAAVRDIPRNTVQAALGAGGAIIGKVSARGLRGKITKQAPGTVVASAWEVLIAVLGGTVLSATINQRLGEWFMVGGIMAPAETAIQSAKIPFVSTALADDGYLVGPGTGTVLVSAHPGDYADAVGAPALTAGAGDVAGAVQDYVTGSGMQDYVTGGMADYVTGRSGQL